MGTTGISTDMDVGAGEGVWLSPPDRVAAVTVAVHIPANESATFVIETSCNRTETIGENGTGGYWDNPFGENAVLHENTVIMLANAVTGIRVNCLTASGTSKINVCFVG
jgi:hypothetical protein